MNGPGTDCTCICHDLTQFSSCGCCEEDPPAGPPDGNNERTGIAWNE